MSNNGKQVQLGPNQTPRYSCIPTRPHTPQRTDAYTVSGAPGFGGGASHMQGGAMRGLPQAPTPPQQDLKQPAYTQGPVRTQSFQYRGGPPQQQGGPRAPAHQRQPTAAAWPQPSPTQMMYNMPVYLSHTLPQAAYQPQQTQRNQYYTQTPPMSTLLGQQHYYNYTNGPSQPYMYSGGSTQGGPLALSAVGGRPTQQMPPMQQPPQLPPTQYVANRYPAPHSHPPNPSDPKKRRTHALAIVDPKSGKDVSEEIYERDGSDSVSEAGDRHPPQPDENSLAVVEEFARLVSVAANKKDVEPHNDVSDKMEIECDSHVPHIRDNTNQHPVEDIDNAITGELEVIDIVICEEKHSKPVQVTELSETPVVSAISNSPEVVPKQCHIVSKQKQITPESATVEPKRSQAAKPVKQNKPSNTIEASTPDEGSHVKNYVKSDLKESQAQQILTSALHPTKSDEHVLKKKIEDFEIPPLVEQTQVSSTKFLSHGEVAEVKGPGTNINTLTQQTTSEPVDLPTPSTQNLSTTKSKADKKNKSRSGATNEKIERISSQNKKADGDQTEVVKVILTNSIPSVESVNTESNVASEPESSKRVEVPSECTPYDSPVEALQTKIEDLTISHIGSEQDVEALATAADVSQESVIETVDTAKEVDNHEQVDNTDSVDNYCNIAGSDPDDVKPFEEYSLSSVVDEEKSSKPAKVPILKYEYKNDQWSPLNTSGKKCYDADFLMMLRNDPNSKKKPPNINQLEIVSDMLIRQSRNNSDTSRALPMGRSNDLLPGFAKGTMQSATPNRKSQHGKPSSKGISTPGSGLNNRPNIIHVNLSLRSDVKLNETENAWKPSRMRSTTMEEEELATQELYKTFRSVLNKLTPQNFDTLIAKVRKFNIDTEARLSGVINLVFEKAIDEPNFSFTYALMCKELEQIKVKLPSESKDERFVSFRGLIVGRCQAEFEKEDNTTKNRQKEIDECTDPEKKKELVLSLEEEERKIRRRSVGNVRFIGELFKQNIILSTIITHCIKRLLHKIEEETLECLCKLLTTIGKALESKGNVNLQPYFDDMKGIVESKEKKVSSRVRFMLQDVIDLRLNNWVPRQQAANPKTMDQIKLEVEMEQKTVMYSNFSNSSNMRDTRKEDNRPSNMNKRGGSKSVTSEDGWFTTTNRAKPKVAPFVVDPGKLCRILTSTPVTQTSLQPSSQFTSWSKGSNVSKKADGWTTGHKSSSGSVNNKKAGAETSNMYSSLDNQLLENVSSNRGDSTRKTNYKSKGASIERSTFKSNTKEQDTTVPEELTISKVKDLLSLTDSVYGMLDKIITNFSQDEMATLVRELLLWGLEYNKKECMLVIGEVTGRMVSDGNITNQEFLTVLKKTMDGSSAYFAKGDSHFWRMLGGFIWKHMMKNNLKLVEIHSAFSQVIEDNKGFELLTGIFMEKLKDAHGDVKDLWERSNMKLSDWMSEERVEQFLEEFELKWLHQDDSITPKEASSRMLQLMQDEATRDDINDWIKEKIGDAVQDPWFIKAITEAVHMYGLCLNEESKPRFDTDTTKRLEAYYPLLSTYVAGNEKLELECLFAIQHLIHKLEHPPGISVKLFDFLAEYGEIIPIEVFLTWSKNDDPKEQEGKGVLLKSLTSFFISIQTTDDSSDDNTSVIKDY